MIQTAKVTKILDNGTAEVSVKRQSACGHDCEECAGCGVTGAAVQARAANPIGAKPGQKVVVQSDTQKMLGIVALVYLTPVVLFLVGYFATIAVASAPIRYLFGGIGFVLGILIAVAYDRRLRRQGGLRFTIVRLF